MTLKLLTILLIVAGVYLYKRDLRREKYPTSTVTTRVYDAREGVC